MIPTTLRAGRALTINGIGVLYIGGMALADWAGLLEQSTMILGVGVAVMWAGTGLYFLDRVVRQPRAFLTRLLIAVVTALALGAVTRAMQLDGKVIAAVMLASIGFVTTLGAALRPGRTRSAA